MRISLIHLAAATAGAIAALTLAVACEDHGDDLSASRNTAGPYVAPSPTLTNVTDVKPDADDPQPDYAGRWADAETACVEDGKAWRLTGKVVEAPVSAAGGPFTCDIASISETHPSARQAVYALTGSCSHTSLAASEDTITFRFGASDTVMQMQLNDLVPLRLIRCPQL